MSLVWLNGKLMDDTQAAISVYDRGFTLGDGLFETMRAYGGCVFRLRAHLERLQAGAARIGLQLREDLEGAVYETVAANHLGDAAIRLTVTRGKGAGGVDVPEVVRPTIVVTVRPYQPISHWYSHGIGAVVARGRLNEHAATAGLKCIGYLDHVIARAEARAAGRDEALLLDTAGHLTDATVSNLFLVINQVLCTPPLACGALPGITRHTVLDLASRLGIARSEDPVPPEALWAASEAFLTSSLREIVPLITVGERRIGSGRPGPLTTRCLDEYRALTRSERRD